MWWVKKFMKLFSICTGDYLAALWSVVTEARTAGLSLSGTIPPGYPKAGYTLVEVAVEYEVIDRSDFGWPDHDPVVDALISCGAEATMSSVEDALRAYRPSLFKTLLHALGETPTPVFIGLWLFYIPECEKYGHFDMSACSELIRVLTDECPMALDHAREALLGAIEKPSITLCSACSACSACSLLRRTNPSCTHCNFLAAEDYRKLQEFLWNAWVLVRHLEDKLAVRWAWIGAVSRPALGAGRSKLVRRQSVLAPDIFTIILRMGGALSDATDDAISSRQQLLRDVKLLECQEYLEDLHKALQELFEWMDFCRGVLDVGTKKRWKEVEVLLLH